MTTPDTPRTIWGCPVEIDPRLPDGLIVVGYGPCTDCEQPRTDLRAGICPDCWAEYDRERARDELRGE